MSRASSNGPAHSYGLLDQGRVIKAIEDATGKLLPMAKANGTGDELLRSITTDLWGDAGGSGSMTTLHITLQVARLKVLVWRLIATRAALRHSAARL